MLHLAVIGLLFLLHLTKPVAQAESGVPVMLGNMGNLDTDYEYHSSVTWQLGALNRSL